MPYSETSKLNKLGERYLPQTRIIASPLTVALAKQLREYVLLLRRPRTRVMVGYLLHGMRRLLSTGGN